MAARPIVNSFSNVGEMPGDDPMRGTHRIGKTTIKGNGNTIDIDLDGAGQFDDDKRELSGDFHENLAEVLYTSERQRIGQRLIEFYEIDKESRKEWEERAKTALVMLGIVKQNKDALPWKGASDVVHPGIAKACVQYQSRAIEEFFPANGPVKCVVIGKATQALQEQGQRVEDFMNWYYTDGDKGYFEDSDQLHFKLPLQGSVFRKSFIDPMTGHPKQRSVDADDFVAPYQGRDLQSMTRYCHRYRLTGQQVKKAVARGYFLEVDLPKGSLHLHDLGQDVAEDKADDREAVMHHEDDVYEFLEYHIEEEMPVAIGEDEAPYALPYIVWVERSSGETLRIERNWEEGDPGYTKDVWFTHYRYLPGLGFYGFGLLHIIGSLGEAATGAVRALLDSGARANMSGGFKSRDIGGGDLTIENGVWKDVDASAEEMLKAFFTPEQPTNGAALFQTLELMTTVLDQFTTVTEAAVGDADNKAPVGTTLALIEQQSKVFSAIHKRTHASARHEFSMFRRLVLLSDYDQYPFQYQGTDQVVFKTDFADAISVLPVSDPNIWSSVQRIALAQTTFQVVTTSPDVYGPKEKRIAHRRLLEALKVPDIDELLPEQHADPYLDPVSENMRMMIGKPSKTWPHQLHAAHVAVHENWLQIQIATQPQEILQRLLPQALAHIQEHKAYMYQQDVIRKLGLELPMFDLGAGEEESSQMPPEIESRLSAAAAQALLPIPPTAQQSADEAANQAEIRRKDALAQADIRRKDAIAAADARRKDAQAHGEHRRKNVVTALDERRKDTAFGADQSRAGQEHALGLAHAQDEHGQDLAHGEEAHAQDLEHAGDAHEQALEHAGEVHDQGIEHADQTQEQELDAARARADAESAALKQQLDAKAAAPGGGGGDS